MKFRNIIAVISFMIFVGCEHQVEKKFSKLNLKHEKVYKNTGFALIHNDDLAIKKLKEGSLQIFHNSLKGKSLVKIKNPLNGKTLIAEVKSNRVKFPNFYNSVITSKIAEVLELNTAEPYVEIILISKNSTFVAKKAKIFEEEKNVAEKAPIDGIKISNLNVNPEDQIKQVTNNIFSYSIKVADFYYKKTAILMVDRIKSKTLIKNIKLIQLSKNNYRVLLGPFNDINSLKESFEKMNSLYFENLEILKNV